ncbi:MAG: hypothetical protein ACKVS7_16680 [Gemmatimonadaceae bacterium]
MRLGGAYCALNLGMDGLHLVAGSAAWPGPVFLVRIALFVGCALISARVRRDDPLEAGLLVGTMVAVHLLLRNLLIQVGETGTGWALLGAFPLMLILLLKPTALAAGVAAAIALVAQPEED